MALILRWTQTWDGSTLQWTETWGDDGVFIVDQIGAIALQGTLGISADVTITHGTTFVLEAVAPIALHGSLGITADVQKTVPWEVLSPLQLGLSGQLGISADLFFSRPSVFEVAQVGAITLQGTLGIQSEIALGRGFRVQPLAPIALSGTLGIVADMALARTFALEQVGTIALSGALGIAADIALARTFVIEPLAPIALSGALAITADVVASVPVVFQIQQVQPIALQGTIGVSASVRAGSPFQITPVAPIALAGSLGIQAEIATRVPFVVQALQPIALTGALGISTAPIFGRPFALQAQAPIALHGQLGVAAALELTIPTTVPDVVGLTQAAAIAAIDAARLVAVIATAFSDTVPAGQVISQAPAGGTASTVGSSVVITVSAGQGAATDPKLIARGRRLNPLLKVKPVRRERAPGAAPAAKPKPTPLLLGLLKRTGLDIPAATLQQGSAPAEPAPVLADASIPLVGGRELPSEAVEEPEVTAPTAADPLALIQQLRADLDALRAEVEQLRAAGTAEVPALRDPFHDALHAILPALRDPIDLDAEPEEPARPNPPEEAPAAPKMTREEIDAENARRIQEALKRLL